MSKIGSSACSSSFLSIKAPMPARSILLLCSLRCSTSPRCSMRVCTSVCRHTHASVCTRHARPVSALSTGGGCLRTDFSAVRRRYSAVGCVGPCEVVQVAPAARCTLFRERGDRATEKEWQPANHRLEHTAMQYTCTCTSH
jgi:hypothetical protein